MRTVLTILLLLLSLVGWLEAREANDGVGFFKTTTGRVIVVRDNQEIAAEPAMQIREGDSVATGFKSSAGIIFRDGTVLTIGADSEVEIRGFRFSPQARDYEFSLHMKRGSLIYSSGKMGKLAPEEVNLSTPRATVGIRGTKLLLAVQ